MLAGWRVFIDANNNGRLDSGEQSFLSSAAGAWIMPALPAGKYVIRIVSQSGYKTTAPVGGNFTRTLTSGSISTQHAFGESH